MVSVAPPFASAMTGFPHAIASTGTMPKSSSPGTIILGNFEDIPLPRYLTFFPKFNIFFRHSFESFRSDPSPIITSLCFGRREKHERQDQYFKKAKVRKQ